MPSIFNINIRDVDYSFHRVLSADSIMYIVLYGALANRKSFTLARDEASAWAVQGRELPAGLEELSAELIQAVQQNEGAASGPFRR